MATHKGPRSNKGAGFEGKSSEKPIYIVPGPVATPVAGFANDVTGTPPAPKMRMAPEPMGTSSLPMGEGRKGNGGSKALGAFGFSSKKDK